MALKAVDLRESEKKRAVSNLKAVTSNTKSQVAMTKARKAGIVRAADRK
ncbi:hypothetical protein HZA99_01245 [Candidatus Woesearchaeota archaeon]|nr:hypothetical protein [Candidatus Woesearchaeota archaeon]